MLKFIPTKEEILLLRDTVQRHKSPTVLALADRFLYEISQIWRYEHRLKCLYTIRTFNERLDELTPYLNGIFLLFVVNILIHIFFIPYKFYFIKLAVIRASTILSNSKKLKQFMTIVLAIGNYLNHGKRIGNAQGFCYYLLFVFISKSLKCAYN